MTSLPRPVIEMNGLRLSRFELDDAAALSYAVEESIEELRPWHPWAKFEPANPEQRLGLLQRWDRFWDKGVEFNYAMFLGEDLIGACALHRTERADTLAIGYRVRTGRTGQGIGTNAAAGLTGTALQLDGIDSVEIHHDKANVASAAIPAELG